MFQLITIFFEGMNERSHTRMNDYSNNKLIKMDPEEAWEMLDEVTNFDASYAPRKRKGGLYEVSPEVNRDVRAQFQQDEANKMKRLVQSLKACQLCHSPDHSALEYTNAKQVHAAEGYTREDANYYRDTGRNMNQRYERAPESSQAPYQ